MYAVIWEPERTERSPSVGIRRNGKHKGQVKELMPTPKRGEGNKEDTCSKSQSKTLLHLTGWSLDACRERVVSTYTLSKPIKQV